MNTLDSIATNAVVVNLASSAIGGALVIGYQRLTQWLALRNERRVWRPFIAAGSPIKVVLTDKPGNLPRSTPKVSLNEVQAFSDIRNVFRSLGREVSLERASGRRLGDLNRESLIILGGPVGNSLARQVLRTIDRALPIEYDEEESQFAIASRRFQSKLDDQGLVAEDYGLVVRLSRLDPSSQESCPVLLAFGIHGHGTGQAVKALLHSRDMMRTIHKVGRNDFYALLRFEFDNHSPIQCDVVQSGSMIRA